MTCWSFFHENRKLAKTRKIARHAGESTKIIDFNALACTPCDFSSFRKFSISMEKSFQKSPKCTPKIIQNGSNISQKNNQKMGGLFDHFLYQNGTKMDPKREPKFRKNLTWARWTANGRPMEPQSFQNGAQWNPQNSQTEPPKSQNGALETPNLTKWTPKLPK